MNIIFVIKNGEVIREILPKNKTAARRQYAFFRKHGICDPETGIKLDGVTFESIIER